MKKSNRYRKALLLSVLCAVGLASAGSVASGDPLKMVPADSLFCVRINNLDGALGQIDTFLSGLFPIGVSMPVKAQLAQFLGSDQPEGIDMAGGFVLFGPLPGAGPDPSRIGLLVPVRNYQQFVSGNANIGQPDGRGISKIGPQDAAMMAAVEVGGYALLSMTGNEEPLVTMKKSGAGTSTLAASLDAAELKRSTEAPLWIYANVELAGRLFGPMVQAKIEEVKETMQAMGAQGQDAMAKQATANIEASAAILDALMNETKYLSISLSPSFEKIGASFVLAAAPGSNMADMFKGDTAGAGNKLMGYMTEGAAVNFAGSMSSPFWRKVNEAYIDLMSKIMGDSASGDDIAAFKKMATDAMDAFGGALAGSFSIDMNSKPPFQATYVADVKDSAKFYRVLEEASKAMTAGSIADLYKEMGMQMSFDLKRNASSYEGVSIDAITFNVKGTDPDSPATQMIDAMYGDGLNVQMATVNNQLVYALGQNAQGSVQKLIDQVKAGGPKQVAGEAQTALAMIPGADKADFFMTVNIVRLMKLVSAFAPIPMPQTDIPTQSSIAIASDASNGRMTLDLAIPKQHVIEIMGLVMQIQQQQMDN